jgi:uncharacterized membrane protein
MLSLNTEDGVMNVTATLPRAGQDVPSDEKKGNKSGTVPAVRYGFIDLLRGFAILMMIETHVVNAYLPVVMKKGSPFFFWLAFINGLVAPAFLFAAGFSLVLQSNHQWDNWLHLRPPFWRQMRRLGFICMVAYYLHLQGFKLSRYISNWDNRLMWSRTFEVDVLQCIFVSLIAVHLIIFIVRKKQLLPWAVGLVMAMIAFTTPWIWAHDFRESLPLAIALFMNPHGISLFPIFPWMVFVLAGSCISCIFLRSIESNRVMQFMRGIAALGAIMIICGLLLRKVPFTLPGQVNFYTTSPLFMMIRLGCVLLICSLLYLLENKWRWVPQTILLAGRESLLVYGLHLWIIYGLLRGKFLSPILGLQFGYIRCFTISICIIIAMLFLAKHYHVLKKNYPVHVRYGQAIIVMTMIAVFVLR